MEALLFFEDKSGATFLHSCARCRSPLVMGNLLAGLSLISVTNLLRATDNEGDTPLHYAAQNETYPDVIRVLLEFMTANYSKSGKYTLLRFNKSVN